MSEDRIDLVPGTLEMLVLKVLSGSRMHGYAIVRRLQQVSDDVLRVEEGSLYPALHRMERRGWVQSSWGKSEANRRAKFYRITPRGRARLAERVSVWGKVAGAIERVLSPEPEGA
jgi:transcriptional regulator